MKDFFEAMENIIGAALLGYGCSELWGVPAACAVLGAVVLADNLVIRRFLK